MTELVEKPKFIVEDEFFAHVERSIDSSGVHPFPGIAVKQDGGIEFASIRAEGFSRYEVPKLDLATSRSHVVHEDDPDEYYDDPTDGEF